MTTKQKQQSKKPAAKPAAKPAGKKATKPAPASKPAAAAKPAPPPATPATEIAAKGRHVQILGHSACAVVRALGQAGVKVAEADAIMRAHGVEMSRASIGVQLGFGRNKDTWAKRGEPAPLDGAQIAQLRNSVQP